MTSLHNPEPRYFTPRNPARKTLGGGVGKIMTAFKNPPMPYQADFLRAACEIDPNTGKFFYRRVVLILPRQGGKTSMSRAKVSHRALTTPDALMLYTAQDRNKARKRLEKNFYLPLKRSPLKAFLGKPRWQAGSEALRFTTGAELGIDAVGEKTGHGDTLTEAHIDEAYAHKDNTVESGIGPTMITVPGSQLWIVSAAGHQNSTYLMNYRDMGRALAESGRESRTLYWEYSAPEDADPLDPATILSAHPAVTHTVQLDDVRDSLMNSTDPVEEQRAYLGWWPKPKAPPRVIPTLIWEAGYVPEDAEAWTGTPFYAVDIDPEREWSSIAMAAEPTDPRARVYLELYERQVGTAGVVEALKYLRQHLGGRFVAMDANGAATSLIKDLEEEGFEVVTASGPKRIAACGGFYDDALDNKMRYPNDSTVNDAMAAAQKKNVGEGSWIFSRTRSMTDISALYAITFARWLYVEKREDEYDVDETIL